MRLFWHVESGMAAGIKELSDKYQAIKDRHPFLGALITKLQQDNIGMLTGFVSWSILTSLVPIVVGIVALSGLVLQNPSREQAVVKQLSHALKGVLSPSDIANLVAAATSHTGLLALVGLAGVIWASASVGGSIATSFLPIFEVGRRPYLKQQAINLVMIFLLTAAMILVVAGSLASAFLNDLLGAAAVPAVVQFAIGTAISMGAAFVLFGSIYFVYPNIDLQFKLGHVWRGALLSAGLFQAVSYIWPLYAHFSNFSKYSAFLVSLLILSAWIYFFAMIMMIGAEIGAVGAIREAQRQGKSVGPMPLQAVPQHVVLRRGDPDGKTTTPLES
jgi:membrane protein